VFFGKSMPLTDPAALRFRMSTLKTGVWLGLAMIASGQWYFVLTWRDGHRALLSAIVLSLAVFDVSVLVRLGWMRRIVAGRWREAFFLSWTLANVASLLLLGAIDPTNPSPLTLPLLMPMLFAGMSYPRRSAAVCCAAVVVGYAIEAIAKRSDLSYSELFLMCLVWTAGMCLWQARNREQQHTELESQRDELARVSRADPLTDALNRRGFQERLELELAEARRGARPLTLAVIDLDGFKDVNDRDGHAAGDELLRQTVRRVREVLRPMDAVGRLGGDEFAVLLTGAGDADADIVVGHLRGALADAVPASIGHACFPGDGVTAQQLLDEADRRLYIVKGHRARKRGDARMELSWAAALADAVDRRMNGPHNHSRAVADYACAIASRLGWTAPELGLLRLAATLHDVGKVAIPDRILNKPTALDADEYAEIKRHVTIGAHMLSCIDDLDEIVPWVRHSHEHLDGSGYPDALAGDQIPAASRILLTADAFDAMTSDRPYRRALHPDDAADELRRHAGTQFDPDCVTALIDSLAPSGRASATRVELAPRLPAPPPAFLEHTS
jgi:diguanylate cyclase (GGDEF)-like protein/putative nucleotidyltransferase with HDIG domain